MGKTNMGDPFVSFFHCHSQTIDVAEFRLVPFWITQATTNLSKANIFQQDTQDTACPGHSLGMSF